MLLLTFSSVSKRKERPVCLIKVITIVASKNWQRCKISTWPENSRWVRAMVQVHPEPKVVQGSCAACAVWWVQGYFLTSGVSKLRVRPHPLEVHTH